MSGLVIRDGAFVGQEPTVNTNGDAGQIEEWRFDPARSAIFDGPWKVTRMQIVRPWSFAIGGNGAAIEATVRVQR
jgi:hypothetical protein